MFLEGRTTFFVQDMTFYVEKDEDWNQEKTKAMTGQTLTINYQVKTWLWIEGVKHLKVLSFPLAF